MKFVVTVAASLLLAACGGSGEDDGVTWEGVSVSNDDKAALAFKCMEHGTVIDIRRVTVIEADGRHHYIRGTCTDGTVVQL